ncbi:MAG: TetR/AcrR family transcriptional regulator C-terminal domain-containing protein [Ruminococcus sp.]|nr:TetR/AcrR family transcriptional regulator C-terminal domain-containing protein [Ruminococcus sp.]
MIKRTTKDILAESFLELAETKRIDKIRISDITDNCGMSPPTFYNHFKDKYDLIVWIHTHRIDEIMKKVVATDYEWKDTLLDGAKYFYDNRRFLVNALRHTSGQDSFVRHICKLNIELVSAEVRKKLMTEQIPAEILSVLKIYIYGTVQFTLEWLIGNFDMTPEQMAQMWEQALPQTLKQYLYND